MNSFHKSKHQEVNLVLGAGNPWASHSNAVDRFTTTDIFAPMLFPSFSVGGTLV